MIVFYWLGFAIGMLAMAVLFIAPVLLVAVRPVRRWWQRLLLVAADRPYGLLLRLGRRTGS